MHRLISPAPSAVSLGSGAYWPQLDGIRAIAFAMVFLHHHGLVVGGPLIVNWYVGRMCEWGWLGVDLFFVLSGFLVTYLLCSESRVNGTVSLGKFYLRRALRIWPLYFLVLLLVCIAYPIFAHTGPLTGFGGFLKKVLIPMSLFVGNFTMWQNLPRMHEFAASAGLQAMIFVATLAPFWSLCVEEQFYLLWGGAARVCKTAVKLMCCAVALAVVGCLSRFALLSTGDRTLSHGVYYMNTLWHIEPIMLGAIVALLFSLKPNWFSRFRAGWLPPLVMSVCLVTVGVVIAWAPGIGSWKLALAPAMSMFSLSFSLMLAVSLQWNPLIKLLSVKPLVFVGKLTFAMYVFHLFVIWSTQKALNLQQLTPQNSAFSMVLCFALTLAAAAISWTTFEKPFNNLRHKLHPVSPADKQSGL